MALLSQMKNPYAICTWFPMLKVALTKPGLTYSEKVIKSWIIYHQDLMLCSYMLYVRIIKVWLIKVWLYADKQCIQSFVGSPESSG